MGGIGFRCLQLCSSNLGFVGIGLVREFNNVGEYDGPFAHRARLCDETGSGQSIIEGGSTARVPLLRQIRPVFQLLHPEKAAEKPKFCCAKARSGGRADAKT